MMWTDGGEHAGAEYKCLARNPRRPIRLPCLTSYQSLVNRCGSF